MTQAVSGLGTKQVTRETNKTKNRETNKDETKRKSKNKNHENHAGHLLPGQRQTTQILPMHPEELPRLSPPVI